MNLTRQLICVLILLLFLCTYSLILPRTRIHQISRSTKTYASNYNGNESKKFMPSEPELAKFNVDEADFIKEEPKNDYALYFYMIILAIPILGFTSFDHVSSFVHDNMILLGKQNWVAVDGGQYQAEILTPAVNGIVVPTISISLATLVAGSIATLRERQNFIRSCLNKEACSVKMLHSALQFLFRKAIKTERKILVASLLYKYTRRVITENSPGDIFDYKVLQSELQELNKLLYFYDLDAGAVQGLIMELNNHRSARLASLQSAFPPLHWALLALLGSSVIFCFLIETDQETIRFLDDIQLRILFSLLCCAVSFTALLCFDLSHPFSGFFNVNTSVKQLVEVSDDIENDLLLNLLQDRDQAGQRGVLEATLDLEQKNETKLII